MNKEKIFDRLKVQGFKDLPSIERFAGGQSHDTFNINNEYVLKVYKNQHHYDANKILSEHDVLGHSAPEIIRTRDNDATLGGSAILMEFIKGTNLTELYHTYDDIQKKATHRKMGEMLQRIHSLDKGAREWETHTLFDRVRKLFDQVVEKGSMTAEQLFSISEVLDRYQPWKKEIEQCRTYGDFHMENMLVSDDGDITLIDRDTSRIAPHRMENEMFFEQSIIPVGIVSEALEHDYPHKLALPTLFDVKEVYPEQFPLAFKDELYLLAILRLLIKYNVGDDVQDKPRAYEMGLAIYEEVFENGLIEKLAS